MKILDDVLAQKLIDRLSGTMNYNVNIIDTAGIIIASYDPSRVGSFHEIAFRMIQSGTRLVEIGEDEKRLGTRPGINMVIENKNEVVGVVGITGNPDTVRPMALLLKSAVESVLEVELQQREMTRRTSLKDRFFQQMLFQDEQEETELSAQAKSLGYHTHVMRIPILIDAEEEEHRDVVAKVCKAGGAHTKDDMLIRLENHRTIVFLHLPEFGDQFFLQCREAVESYLEDVRQYADRNRINCRYYIGSIQNRLSGYRAAYQHCKWLQKNTQSDAGDIIFFYDYLQRYIESLVPLTELHQIFGPVRERLTDDFCDSYMAVTGAMIKYNNNMVKASASMHMHKNTLVYKYNQIRETLGINPIENGYDNQIATQLFYYLKQT